MNKVYCDHCKSTNVVEDKNSGELICGDCGNVIEKIIYPEPEWRAYSYSDRVKRERAGAPITPLLHDMGLSTRCRTSFSRFYSSEDRAIIEVLSEIYRISSSLNISEPVAQTAATFLRKIGKSDKFVKRHPKVLAISLLYLSLRAHGIPRDLKELAKAAGADQRMAWKYCLRLAESLDVRNLVGADAYVSKIVKALGLPGKVEKLANDIYVNASLMRLTQGKNRKAVAAALVYLAAKRLGVPVSQRRLVESVDVSNSSLKRRIREFKAALTDGDIRKEA